MCTFSKISALVSVPIVLLFTKVDLLEKELGIHAFRDYFPDYTGSQTTSDICEYFATEFRRLDRRPEGILHMSVVNAADPDDFLDVYEAMSTGIFYEATQTGISTLPPEGSGS